MPHMVDLVREFQSSHSDPPAASRSTPRTGFRRYFPFGYRRRPRASALLVCLRRCACDRRARRSTSRLMNEETTSNARSAASSRCVASVTRKMRAKSVAALARMAAALKIRRHCHLGPSGAYQGMAPGIKIEILQPRADRMHGLAEPCASIRRRAAALFTRGDDAMRIPSRSHDSSFRLKCGTTNGSPFKGAAPCYVSVISCPSRGTIL